METMLSRRACLILPAAATLRGQRKPYPYRWVYVSRSLREDRHVEDIRRIARTAGEHGLNGMVLSAGLDRLELEPPDYFARLEQVKDICREHRLAIIPIIFSAGYGGSILAFNRNLAEGLPVKDALFVARGGEARLEADPPLARLEKSGGEVAVRPYRCYRVSARVKTEGLQPEGSLRVQVLAEDGRALAPLDLRVPSTTDWRKVVLGFNSLRYDRVRISAGARSGGSGRAWVEDLGIEEIGLVNVLRRPGTPVVVRSDRGDMTYQEGVDYAPVADDSLTFRFDHDGPPIRLLPDSRIAEGQRLRVSYYHGISINRGQVTVCMSEPEIYDIWRRQARRMHEVLRPEMYLLSMDEVRAGGTCQACQRSGLSMARILGDCITRQVEILRGVNPDARVFVWSDMLDPNHNARGNYYLVEGDYTGSWKHVPKDLVIVCWYYNRRRDSLAHFSGLGFKTLAGAYYDGDTLDNPKGWLEALEATDGACGIMYTTWQNKYELLAGFGDLVGG